MQASLLLHLRQMTIFLVKEIKAFFRFKPYPFHYDQQSFQNQDIQNFKIDSEEIILLTIKLPRTIQQKEN